MAMDQSEAVNFNLNVMIINIYSFIESHIISNNNIIKQSHGRPGGWIWGAHVESKCML